MKIGRLNINISSKKESSEKLDNDIFSNNNLEASLIGHNIGEIGKIKTSKKDAFTIMKKNVIISAAWKLVANRVGANGISLKDLEGNTVDLEKDIVGKEIVERANYFFSTPSLYNYVYRSFGMILGAGQKFSTLDEMDGLGQAKETSKIKILDSRYINILHDAYGNPTKYEYRGKEKFGPTTIVDYIVYEDLDNTLYGQSQIESIIIDALSDSAIADRQLMFFNNNAMPNVVYMLDTSRVKNMEQVKEFEKKIKEKHGGNLKSNKPLASNMIKDIKILEMSHKDLDLINQRLFSHKEGGVILGFDLRLLSYMKDTGGSFSEMDTLTLKNANSQIEVYSKRIEDGMKMEYEKFIGPIPYSFKLKNELYKDIKGETEIVKMQIETGLITPNMGLNILDMQSSKDKRLDEYYLSNSLSIMGIDETTQSKKPTTA